MRNVSHKFVEKIKTHILCSITVPENRVGYEIMWTNTVDSDTPDGNVIRRMRFTCRLTKARMQTHSEYVIHIAFPRQKWLRERASMLHYTYFTCLVK